MGQAMVLPLDVQLEVLSCLEPREIGRVAAVSRLCHKADRTPLLWFHVYSRLFRHHLPAPPRFRDIRGGAATALPIKDFDWRTLTIRRAVIDADRFQLVTEVPNVLDIRAAPAERRGMVDTYVIKSGRHSGRTTSAVLRHKLVPLPLARPLAYAEAWILGGASVGLIKGTQTPWYPRTAHIGWYNGAIGYHGDDGRIYQGNSTGRPFGPTFGFDPARVHRNAGPDVPHQPDVIGVGVERCPDGHEQAFFTKNAVVVGAVPLPVSWSHFFAFALDAGGDYASVNGGSARFLFDLEAYSQQPPHPLTYPRPGPRRGAYADSSDSDSDASGSGSDSGSARGSDSGS